MQYLWTSIHVRDLEEAVTFYQEVVGLSLESRIAPNPEKQIAFLGEGETKLELIFEAGVPVARHAGGISLGFPVDSLDQKKVWLQEKGIQTTEVYQPNPNLKFFFLDDPNGIKVQFVERIHP